MPGPTEIFDLSHLSDTDTDDVDEDGIKGIAAYQGGVSDV